MEQPGDWVLGDLNNRILAESSHENRVPAGSPANRKLHHRHTPRKLDNTF
jgi:hypothetical protein